MIPEKTAVISSGDYIQKIHPAMIAVMRDVAAIGKNSENKQQGFKFRGIDTIYNEMHGLMSKHGIVMLPLAGEPRSEERPTKLGGVLRYVTLPMTYRFMAEDGSSVDCTVVGEGMDSGDKATNKAMAIGHKYALLQTFLIPTEDMPDPDSETHEPAPRENLLPDLNKILCTVISVTEKKSPEVLPNSSNSGFMLGEQWIAYICELSDGRRPGTLNKDAAKILMVMQVEKISGFITCDPGTREGSLEIVEIVAADLKWRKP